VSADARAQPAPTDPAPPPPAEPAAEADARPDAEVRADAELARRHDGGGPRFEVDGLAYALDAPPRRHGRRSVISVRRAGSDAPPLVDRVDMFAFRSRRKLARLVADVLGRDADVVLGHLAVVLDAVERADAEAAEAGPRPEELTPERRAAAEDLLAQPDLLDRAAAAMEAAGHVGEDAVKRLAYLAATSRLMAHPLSVLLLAPSGTGKSAVLDAVAALMPSEQVVPLVRLTEHSLYYMGPDALRHKLVVVDEYEGAGAADHPLRVLQSKGELRMSSTVKGRAQEFVVRGPVAVVSGTTATNLDVQNTSRCLVLALDDSPEQTARVQAAQARAWSGHTFRTTDLQVWADAQRLLEPAEVAIPFAERLAFSARTTADRRAPGQILGLVGAHALLRQRRRERDAHGLIVATPEDYAFVHDLLQPAIEQDLDGLPPRAARAYRVLAEAGEPRTRREVAAALGWHYMTASRGLDDLVAHELARVVDAGPPRRYRPLEPGVLGGGATLTPPDEVR